MSESADKRILYMEDDPAAARLVQKRLGRAGYVVETACDGEAGLAMYAAGAYVLVAVDQNMPGLSGLDVIRILAERGGMPPVIVITGTGSEQIAVAAMKLGASDYIVKDVAGGYLELLPLIIERALQQHRLVHEKQQAEAELRRSHTLLEQRVAERTAELAHINQALQAEIAERRRTEAELRMQKTLLECQSDASIDGILVVDLDQHVLFYNRRFAEMWQMSPAMMQQSSFATRIQVLREQLVVPEEFAARIRYLYEHPDVISSDEIYFNDGRVYERYSAPVKGSDGTKYGRVWYDRDVTAMRQAQAALQKSHNLLEKVLSSLNEAVMVVNPFTRLIEECNQTTETMFGYSRAELIGQATDFLHVNAEMFTIFGRAALQAYASPGVFTTEYQMRRKSGEIFPTEHVITPLRDDAGQVVNVVSVVRDITERKRAEEKLKQRNEQLARLNLVIEAINQSLALSEVFSTLRIMFAEYLVLPAGAIYLYHKETDHISLEETWGLLDIPDEQRRALAVTMAHNQRVVWEQSPLVMYDLNDITMTQVLPETLRTSACCYLGVPLLARGEIQGVIDLFSADPEAFRDDHVTFLAIVGQQVGSAIQRARLFSQVQAGHERLQTLSRRLVEIQEAERRAIARELHDEVGQILTGLSLSLEMVNRPPLEQIPSRLAHARSLVSELLQQVREMSLQLRPPMLDDLGLLPTLRWYFDRYTSQTGIQVAFKHSGLDQQRFGNDIEVAVYRMVQEALTNVARYADTHEVVVRLWVNQTMIGVQIADAGRGFDPIVALASHTSSGLAGMQERLRLLGGELTIDAAPGQGSCLAVELPLGRDEF
ncbi:MAG: PAS domain S-box protein [Chloroflexaceae bacterium]